MRSKHKKYLWCFLLLSPTIIGLCILNIYPMIQTLLLMFTESKDFGVYEFTGFKTIQKVFSDPQLWQATKNTITYAVCVVPIATAISLILAILLNQKIKGATIYRVLFFLPVMAVPAASGLLFAWMFNTDYGIANYLLSLLGIDQNIPWLTNSTLVKIPIIIIAIWSLLGYNTVLFLAGLQTIPAMYYEVAKIDGASPLAMVWHITIPLVSPTTFFVITTTTLQTLLIFDFIFTMIDQRNPAFLGAQSLAIFFFRKGFNLFDLSFASVIVGILLMIMTIFAVTIFYLQKKMVTYAE